jgi:hypothetical protein
VIRVVEDTHDRPEAGRAVGRTGAVDHRRGSEQFLELRYPCLLDRRLLQHRQQVVTVRCGAEAARDPQARRHLSAVPGLQRLQLADQGGIVGLAEKVVCPPDRLRAGTPIEYGETLFGHGHHHVRAGVRRP